MGIAAEVFGCATAYHLSQPADELVALEISGSLFRQCVFTLRDLKKATKACLVKQLNQSPPEPKRVRNTYTWIVQEESLKSQAC